MRFATDPSPLIDRGHGEQGQHQALRAAEAKQPRHGAGGRRVDVAKAGHDGSRPAAPFGRRRGLPSSARPDSKGHEHDSQRQRQQIRDRLVRVQLVDGGLADDQAHDAGNRRAGHEADQERDAVGARALAPHHEERRSQHERAGRGDDRVEEDVEDRADHVGRGGSPVVTARPLRPSRPAPARRASRPWRPRAPARSRPRRPEPA